MAKRQRIPDKTKLAAALLQMVRPAAGGGFEPVITHEHAKMMTAEQIVSLFHFDHYPIPHAAGGPDEPWNLVPRPIAEHRVKTAKVDVPALAKGARLARDHEAFRARLLAKGDAIDIHAGDRPTPTKRRWPSRPFPKRQKG